MWVLWESESSSAFFCIFLPPKQSTRCLPQLLAIGFFPERNFADQPSGNAVCKTSGKSFAVSWQLPGNMLIHLRLPEGLRGICRDHPTTCCVDLQASRRVHSKKDQFFCQGLMFECFFFWSRSMCQESLGLQALPRSCAVSVEPGEPLGTEMVMDFFLVGSQIDDR